MPSFEEPGTNLLRGVLVHMGFKNPSKGGGFLRSNFHRAKSVHHLCNLQFDDHAFVNRFVSGLRTQGQNLENARQELVPSKSKMYNKKTRMSICILEYFGLQL